MKRVEWIAFAAVVTQLAHYHAIGNQPYCNVSPSEKTIQCNYESSEACMAYLLPGQRCIGNHDYIGDLPGNSRLQPYDTSSPILKYRLYSPWEKSQRI